MDENLIGFEFENIELYVKVSKDRISKQTSEKRGKLEHKRIHPHSVCPNPSERKEFFFWLSFGITTPKTHVASV